MNNEIELSVIIPCLNEEKTISTCIEKCLNSFRILNINGEIIVSDNGSTDNSIKEALAAGAEVVNCTQKGYGNALKFGFSKASGKYVIMGDADNTYDFNEIPKLYNQIKSVDADIVNGSRFKGNIEKNAMPFLHRYLGTPVLTNLVNVLYKTRVSDITSGLKIFKLASYKKTNCISGGMQFVVELLLEFKIKKLYEKIINKNLLVRKINNIIEQYCNAKKYDLVWMNLDVEDVYLGKEKIFNPKYNFDNLA